MNLPNKLTILRILLIPVMIVFFYLSLPYARYIAAGIFIIASLTDTLDGHIARSRGLITDFGKFLDPIADKLLVVSAFLMLVETGMLSAVIVIIIIAREFIVSAFRMVAAAAGLVIAAGPLGKIKTITQMFAVIFLLVESPDWALWGVTAGTFMAYVCLIMTVWSGVDYIVSNKHVLNHILGKEKE
jgi:CDP-diacylglycerol--glycerol-3-phosphate 3-phosphatidyltransferase